MDIKNVNRVKEVLEEYENFKYIKRVIEENYDSIIRAEVYSQHNFNKQSCIRKYVELPKAIQDQIKEYIDDKIQELEEEIEKL